MAIARFRGQVKRSYQSYGFCIKLSAVVVLGMCFVFVWSIFTNFSVASQRETFDDIEVPVSASSQIHSNKIEPKKEEGKDKQRFGSRLSDKDKKIINGSVPLKPEKKPENANAKGGVEKGDGNSKVTKGGGEKEIQENEGSEVKKEKEGDEGNAKEDEDDDSDGNGGEEDANFINTEEFDQEVVEEDLRKSKKKKLGPLFDLNKRYSWKLCNTRSKHNYIPCVDIESGSKKLQSYRHHERSCPRSAFMCLVSLPPNGYGTPVYWPESKTKV